jgi:hypothetical protein
VVTLPININVVVIVKGVQLYEEEDRRREAGRKGVGERRERVGERRSKEKMRKQKKL